jgi:hypothetical protein
MALQMIHRHQRQAAGQGYGLAEREADHHAPHQARARGGRHAGETIVAHARLGQGGFGDGLDGLHMGARGDLRHHAPIGRMGGHLAAHDGRQHLRAAVGVAAHHRGGGLVAAGLDAEDGLAGGHPVAGNGPLL